jgi:flavin reductase (DIM6/NTAB) family NADH-FMN oxidoreductase RutF
VEKRVVKVRPFWYSDIFVFPKLITVITSYDREGRLNAAPYSFIMQYDVMSKHPRLLLGFRNTSDTFRNIEATGEFVINCPSHDYLADMMETARLYPHGVNELEHTRFTTIPSQKVRPPSIKECKQIIECSVDKIYHLDRTQGHVIANIEALVFDEDLIDVDREERLRRLDLPIGLGDQNRKLYYFTSSRDVQCFELRDVTDETELSEDEVHSLNVAERIRSHLTMEWDPGAIKALEQVPGPVLSLVITETEAIVRGEGSSLVTLERFTELAEEYAPQEVLDRFVPDGEAKGGQGDDDLATLAPPEELAHAGAESGLVFLENSRAMYRAAIAGAPRPFRARTQKRLDEQLALCSGPVSERMIVDAVVKITPKPFLKLALKRIEPLRTGAAAPN